MNYFDAKHELKYSRPKFSLTALLIEAVLMVGVAAVIVMVVQ